MKLTPLHTLIRDYQLPSNVLRTMKMKSFFLCKYCFMCVDIKLKKKKRQSELAKLIPEKEKKQQENWIMCKGNFSYQSFAHLTTVNR